MKKFLAVLLTLAMVFSLNGFAFAESSAEKTAMTPGTYEGSANGQNGKVVVKVTVTDKAIESIEVTEQQETPGIGAPLTDEG